MQQGRWSGEVVFRHFKTGEAIPFLVDWFRIDDPRTGRPMNIATVSRDLRAQKRAEAELRDLNDTLEQRVAERTRDLERAHEKLVAETSERERADARLQELQLELFHAARLSVAGQMGAALAHEINQPLTATANSINAARRLLAATGSGDVSTLKDVMEEAAEQALRGGQIVRRLRAFVTRGETEKHLENLPTLIKEASGLALIGISSLGVQVEFRFDPNAPDVFADRVQIQQVLVNLMRNAFEAMAQTENRQLVISTTRIDHATVEVMVADSGPGLPDDIVRHLFEPFFSTREDGMGLGLSICRSIVEAHGGALNGEPNPGGGTIFRFTLSALPTREDGDDA
jgi:C4-dicarboxylate-specific signal transduction histidine kinase